MKNNSLLLAGIVLLTSLSCQKDQPSVPPDGPPVLNAYPVERNLFGFNTGSTFYFIRPDVPQSQTIIAHWLDSLQIKSLRFPGGRDANFYHHDGRAYGFKESEFESGHSEADTEAELWQDIKKKEDSYPAGVNVKEPFVEMANRQAQAASLFTVNIIHAGYEENRDALQWLLAHNANIGGIELGNETYLNIHRDSFPTPEDYLQKAKSWATRFRQDFPGLKIGIVGAPVRADPVYGAYYLAWNDALAKEDFYDAVCWHHYVRFDACGYDVLAETVWDCVHDSLMRESRERLPDILNYWKQKFPAKKLWLTEWNVSAYRKDYISSQMANLYYSAYLLRLARFSAENNGFVTYAHHHNLLANGKFPIMRPDIDNPSFFDKCERRPAFLAFAGLRDLFDGNTFWLAGSSFFGFQDTTQQALGECFLHVTKTGERELIVALVNPAATSNTLHWKPADNLRFKVGNKRYEGVFSGTVSGFSGKTLQSGLNGIGEIDPIDAVFNGPVAIPAFSVQLLRLPLSE